MKMPNPNTRYDNFCHQILYSFNHSYKSIRFSYSHSYNSETISSIWSRIISSNIWSYLLFFICTLRLSLDIFTFVSIREIWGILVIGRYGRLKGLLFFILEAMWRLRRSFYRLFLKLYAQNHKLFAYFGTYT